MKCPSASDTSELLGWAASRLIVLGSDAWLWPQAGSLFRERGTLGEVCPLAGQWEEGVKEGGVDSPHIWGVGCLLPVDPEIHNKMFFRLAGCGHLFCSMVFSVCVSWAIILSRLVRIYRIQQ